MVPLILLGAGLAGFLIGKNQKKQEIGRANPREVAREKQRRIVSLATFHQAKRKGLSDKVAVATAQAVYQAKGGRDIAHIARLDSMDKDFIGARADRQQRRQERRENRQPNRAQRQENRAQRQENRAANRAERKAGRQGGNLPAGQGRSPRPSGARGSGGPGQRPVNNGPRPSTGSNNSFRPQDEFEEDFDQSQNFQSQGQGSQQQGFQQDQGFEEEQEEQEPIIVVNQAAPQQEEPEEPEAEEPEMPPDQTAAAVAFTRAKDAGEQDATAREKAKAAYQAMGGQDKSFLERIATWSEG